jgi:uracil-DNA glycosylase
MAASGARELALLREEVLACRACAGLVPEPRPVLRVSATARLLIVGQAPGRKVHATGIPWNDPSGDTLRTWLGVDRDTFYDETRVAIVPMGLCYPGHGPHGDLPPRPECAPLWHRRLLAAMPAIELVLLVGDYAQRHYLPAEPRALTERVRGFACYGPRWFPLPHPSPRNRLWLRRNPWFEARVLPALRERVAPLLA